ncbi:hypothetical protein [Streptomyces pacificus]|nr:hypothetical protein [Streptomyces pacificus]
MTASDQETPPQAPANAGAQAAPEAPVGGRRRAPAPASVSAPASAPASAPVPESAPVTPEAPASSSGSAEAPVPAKSPAAAEKTPMTAEAPASGETPAASPEGMSPRQARLLRIAAASVLLAALAAVLAVRLASRTSVLVVGVYGLAMILCGVVIELSRHGRTRLGTYLLGVGLVTALVADWLLLP